MKINNNFLRFTVLIISCGLLTLSCGGDDSSEPINLVSPPEEEVALEQVFNNFVLEDRTEGGVDASMSISMINNGSVQMLRDSLEGNYFLNFSGFMNIGAAIDRSPDIIASRFAVFLATSGAELATQNSFETGDQPVYIGNLETNESSRMALIPAENAGGLIGGITVNTNANIALTGQGSVREQQSTGVRNAMYDWVILHPFEGENLRPITYPGIVANLDGAHQLEQNFVSILNAVTLQDRTEGGANPENSVSNINNGSASVISYDNQTFIRFSDFMNINEPIDRDNPNIIASRFAVFLAISGEELETQNSFDEGDQPVYIGNIEANGFQDMLFTPSSENVNGEVILGSNNITINSNENINLDANNFIIQQQSSGNRNLAYSWIILHPFEGEDLRPISYPGIVANLSAESE